MSDVIGYAMLSALLLIAVAIFDVGRAIREAKAPKPYKPYQIGNVEDFGS